MAVFHEEWAEVLNLPSNLEVDEYLSSTLVFHKKMFVKKLRLGKREVSY